MSVAKQVGTLWGALIFTALATASFGQITPTETLEQALVRGYYNSHSQSQRSLGSDAIGGNGITIRDSDYLINAATGHMDLLRDTAIFYIYNNYLDELNEDVRMSRDNGRLLRMNPAELTQIDAERSEKRAAQIALRLKLKASVANYEALFGVHPRVIGPGTPLSRGLPQTLDEATAISQNEHPSIREALASLAVATRDVAISRKGFDTGAQGHAVATMSAESISFGFRNISEPLYDSAVMYPRVAVTSGGYGAAKAQLDARREVVRRSVVSAWASYSGSEAQIEKAHTEILRYESAVKRAHKKSKAGGSTMTGIVKARRGLLEARIALVAAQRDRVIASYVLLDTIGRLSLKGLEAQVERKEMTRLSEYSPD